MDPNKAHAEPTIRQSKTALLEAAQAAIADQKTKASHLAPPPKRRTGRLVFRTILGLLLVGSAALLVIRPTWLVGPSLPAEDGPIQSASARLSLVDAIAHVRSFVAATGRMPNPIQEAGVTNQGISLQSLGSDEFEVSLQAGDSLIKVRSTDSLKAIVEAAVRTLQRRT